VCGNDEEVVGARPARRVRVEQDDSVWVLTLDDPERHNALGVPARRQLLAALEQAVTDPACRALVLTGAGGTFCSGGDLSTMPSDDRAAARARLDTVTHIVRLLVRGPKPVVAAVEGVAYGAGLSLAAACDHVVAAADARFCCSFGRVGLIADSGLLWTLPQRVGRGRAAGLLLFGEPLSGSEAAGIGLVDHVVEPGAALTVARERARRLAEAAPLAIRATKAALGQWPYSLDDALALEASTQAALYESGDFSEGRASFFGKRPPSFTGS
jgi:2-(1,2-epoxy-1,2-dihydrophenyl)acetyl-CoA isomerase